MKTFIKSVFLTAILALVVTGCQKESDDLNVSLKSLIPFEGGYYETDWTSGDAESECALAGGCDGGSYKIDSGVDAGVYFNEGGITVTGINKQKFSWTSIYPVCKIIVKAGRGAYIFDIGGLKSGTVPYPTDLDVKAKDISHITFCFGKEPSMLIAFKTQSTCGAAYTVVDGMLDRMIDYYTFVEGYNGLIYLEGDMQTPFGEINVSDIDADGLLEVVIDNRYMPTCYFRYSSYLFVGTLNQLQAITNDFYGFPYQQTLASGVNPSSVVYNLPF